MQTTKLITYKRFKILSLTERLREKYSLYSSTANYIIINPDNEYEWETDSINEAKEWIDCY